jgi:hypothetical protein
MENHRDSAAILIDLMACRAKPQGLEPAHFPGECLIPIELYTPTAC